MVIVVLLVVAIVFSVISISMNLSVGDFEKVSSDRSGTQPESFPIGDSDGNLNLVIEKPVEGGANGN